jgi:hypothetical protein
MNAVVRQTTQLFACVYDAALARHDRRLAEHKRGLSDGTEGRKHNYGITNPQYPLPDWILDYDLGYREGLGIRARCGETEGTSP